LLVNGFGGTPGLELYLMYNAARRILEKRGLAVTRSLVGSYVTSLEMAGCSITVTFLDDKLTALWDDPVHTAALRSRRFTILMSRYALSYDHIPTADVASREQRKCAAQNAAHS
jgi:hypothetical protein